MKKLLVLLLAALSLISCDRILDSYWENKEKQDAEENYTSQWRGTWVGTYTGNRSGDITIKVYKKGYVDLILSGGINGEISYGTVYNGTGAIQSFANASNDSFFLYGNLLQKHGTWKYG